MIEGALMGLGLCFAAHLIGSGIGRLLRRHR